jgi:hypothetical protein
MQRVMIGGHEIATSAVFRSYWRFAAERQRVYRRRLSGAPGPWTDDPVIARFRFTNAYRAADRVSQDLIRVQYDGPQDADDLVLRTLLFRLFNKPSTWATLEAEIGELNTESYSIDRYGEVLDAMFGRGERVYSAAYIIPPPPFGATRKHSNHLRLIGHMMQSGVTRQLQDARSLAEVFKVIASYPSLGPFLAYQLTIDLNYSALLDFDENDFVVPGPGALSGIAKCFPGLPSTYAADVIRWMVDHQEAMFDEFDLEFADLFGRRLSLIDCQNLFCETDKYARIVHPEARGVGGRSRIKQQFAPTSQPTAPFFPPKWGINDSARQVREDVLVSV